MASRDFFLLQGGDLISCVLGCRGSLGLSRLRASKWVSRPRNLELLFDAPFGSLYLRLSVHSVVVRATPSLLGALAQLPVELPARSWRSLALGVPGARAAGSGGEQARVKPG